jgi:hypothetical protein
MHPFFQVHSLPKTQTLTFVFVHHEYIYINVEESPSLRLAYHSVYHVGSYGCADLFDIFVADRRLPYHNGYITADQRVCVCAC